MRLGKSGGAILAAAAVSFLLEPLFPLGDWRWAIVAGIGLLVYALSDGQMWRRLWERTSPRGGPEKGPRPAKSKVSTTVNPEQSEIHWLGGGTNFFFSVFVSAENQLDIDVKFRTVRLSARMKDGSRLDAGVARFQHEDLGGKPDEVDWSKVCIPARTLVDGWFLFSQNANIRIADFKSFELQIQAVGEPLEVHRFEPYDWEDVKKGQSTIVMQS